MSSSTAAETQGLVSDLVFGFRIDPCHDLLEFIRYRVQLSRSGLPLPITDRFRCSPCADWTGPRGLRQ